MGSVADSLPLFASSSTHKPVAPAGDFTSDDIDTYMIAMETTCDETEPSPSPAFATRQPSSETRESESENEDTVLGTPPQKRVGGVSLFLLAA